VKVVQCWDDGVADDIRVAEICRKHGAKASFNLNPGLHSETRGAGWKFRDVKQVERLALPELPSVYEGMLIANHSVSHPHLDRIPIADAVREIVDGRDRLEQIFGYEVVGFAYPFGTHNQAVEDAIRDAGHVYARTTENVVFPFPPEDPMRFHSNCHFKHERFWEIYEKAKPGGVFYFWGHSYEIMDEKEWQAFDAQIAKLTADPDVEWTFLPELFTA
jgi:peptidoglycan/xylan/chitin deacetylase (PgdA/CDA1 family)